MNYIHSLFVHDNEQCQEYTSIVIIQRQVSVLSRLMEVLKSAISVDSIPPIIRIHRNSTAKGSHPVHIHLSGQSVCTLSIKALTKLYPAQPVDNLPHW